MIAQDFTPLSALAGGALIGLGCAVLLIAHGKVAGISGICGGLVRGAPGDLAWRLWFVAGLVVTAIVVAQMAPAAFAVTVPRAPIVLVASGLLVGFGTRLGGGCTSGHGLCGTSRLSRRSVAATLTFMLAGMAVATVVGPWLARAGVR